MPRGRLDIRRRPRLNNSNVEEPMPSLPRRKFQVRIPEHARPGDDFRVQANGRIVLVKCPRGCVPGQWIQIIVPPSEDMFPQQRNCATANDCSSGSTRLNDDSYLVTIPAGVRAGNSFPVSTIDGRVLVVTCPLNEGPGSRVRIRPPPPTSLIESDAHMYGVPEQNTSPEPREDGSKPLKKIGRNSRLYQVKVPMGAKPGEPLALDADGIRITVNCPMNARPGQFIQFRLPTDLRGPKTVLLERDGWARRLRLPDMKLIWTRANKDGLTTNPKRFDIQHSAYVRSQSFEAQKRDKTSGVSLVPAGLAVMDTRVHDRNGKVLVSHSDVLRAHSKTFVERAKWFHNTCSKLTIAWNEGHMRINVRRDYLLHDSVQAIMSIEPKDLRKLWRFSFVGEKVIDAGGATREWFHLVTSQIFDPDIGLWKTGVTNQMAMEINPTSDLCCDNHLMLYRFLGRAMGKALFDQQIIGGRMVKHIYKHLLGWPVSFSDLEAVDEEYYNNLKQLISLVESGGDLSELYLDFTTSQTVFGSMEEVELVERGAQKPLTNDNLPEYLEACLKYRLMDAIKPQLNEILLGCFEVVPEALLTVFDYQDLELLMCGLPTINMRDWEQHSQYEGLFRNCPNHIVCRWFWEIVDGFDEALKARLLQFVTGTPGVPPRGFAALQGNDGNIRMFTINGISTEVSVYPRAHTCFNRIDLPLYDSKQDLETSLRFAVEMCATGLHMHVVR